MRDDIKRDGQNKTWVRLDEVLCQRELNTNSPMKIDDALQFNPTKNNQRPSAISCFVNFLGTFYAEPLREMHISQNNPILLCTKLRWRRFIRALPSAFSIFGSIFLPKYVYLNFVYVHLTCTYTSWLIVCHVTKRIYSMHVVRLIVLKIVRLIFVLEVM